MGNQTPTTAVVLTNSQVPVFSALQSQRADISTLLLVHQSEAQRQGTRKLAIRKADKKHKGEIYALV